MRFPILAFLAVVILSSASVMADRKGHQYSTHKVKYELENLQRFNDLNDTFDNYHSGTGVPYTTDDYREK